MPRSAKNSDDETETRTGRKTRTATGASISGEPLRRSTRIRQTTTGKQSVSLLDSSMNDSGNVQLSRTTRRGTGSMDSHAPNKRNTRRNLADTSALDVTLDNIQSKRSTRAGSEGKSTPPIQVTRKTRASSLDPPVSALKRASIAPSSPPVAEKSERKQSIPYVELENILPKLKETCYSGSSEESLDTEKPWQHAQTANSKSNYETDKSERNSIREDTSSIKGPSNDMSISLASNIDISADDLTDDTRSLQLSERELEQDSSISGSGNVHSSYTTRQGTGSMDSHVPIKRSTSRNIADTSALNVTVSNTRSERSTRAESEGKLTPLIQVRRKARASSLDPPGRTRNRAPMAPSSTPIAEESDQKQSIPYVEIDNILPKLKETCYSGSIGESLDTVKSRQRAPSANSQLNHETDKSERKSNDFITLKMSDSNTHDIRFLTSANSDSGLIKVEKENSIDHSDEPIIATTTIVMTPAITSKPAETRAVADTNVSVMINIAKNETCSAIKTDQSSAVTESGDKMSLDISKTEEFAEKNNSIVAEECSLERKRTPSLKSEECLSNDEKADSDINIRNSFQDITANEWESNVNPIGQKKHIESEISLVHSMSTGRLENESEAECDLILVDKEACLTTENLKARREKENPQEEDSKLTTVCENIKIDVNADSTNSPRSQTEKCSNVAVQGNKKALTEIRNDDGKITQATLENVESASTISASLLKTSDPVTSTRRDTFSKLSVPTHRQLSAPGKPLSADLQIASDEEKTSFKRMKVSQSDITKSKDRHISKSEKLLKDMSAEELNDTPRLTETVQSERQLVGRRSLIKSNIVESDGEEVEVQSFESCASKHSSTGKDNNDCDRLNVASQKKRKSLESKYSFDDDISDDVGDDANGSATTDKERIPKKPRKNGITRNDSVMVHVDTNSENGGDSNVDTDGSDDKSGIVKIPKFLYAGTTTTDDSDDPGSDVDSGNSINYNIECKFHPHAKNVLKYLNDSAPADECRTSETESSDSQDNGSDLDDFVVDDDESEEENEKESNEEEEEGEDEQKVDKTDIDNDDEDEGGEEEEGGEDEEENGDNDEKGISENGLRSNVYSKTTTKGERCPIGKQNVQKLKGRVQRIIDSDEEEKDDAIRENVNCAANVNKPMDRNSRVKEEEGKKNTESQRSTERVDKNSVVQLNESEIIFSRKVKKLDLSIGSSTPKANVPKYEGFAEMLSTSAIISANVSSSKEYLVSTQITEMHMNEEPNEICTSVAKGKRGEKCSISRRAVSKDMNSRDDKAKCDETGDAVKPVGNAFCEIDRSNKKKKEKRQLITRDEPVKDPEACVDAVKGAKGKKEKRNSKEENVVILMEKVARKREKRKVAKVQEDNAASSDSAESSIYPALSKARGNSSLESRKRVNENIKGDEVGKKLKNKKKEQRRYDMSIRQGLEESILVLDASERILKRLPEEDLEKFCDVPLRPRKKQKVDQQEGEREEGKAFHSTIASGMVTASNISARALRGKSVSSLSFYGSTSHFSVESLQKVKRTRPSIALFRQAMLSRNGRHLVSAYLMYIQKQKALRKQN